MLVRREDPGEQGGGAVQEPPQAGGIGGAGEKRERGSGRQQPQQIATIHTPGYGPEGAGARGDQRCRGPSAGRENALSSEPTCLPKRLPHANVCRAARPDPATLSGRRRGAAAQYPEYPHARSSEGRLELLFDGNATRGWRGYQKKTIPAGWQAVDGALTRVAAGGDIVTEKQYRDFELALEWKIAPGGNSGIFYRVTEASTQSYHSGPEMQVLDAAANPDGKDRLTAAGAAYGLYPAPAGVVKPAGEWNQVRLMVRGHHVEHWLNDVKVVEYELMSPDWEARVRASKFKEWPGYGRATRGYIALQDHGDQVAFRSIRIRELR